MKLYDDEYQPGEHGRLCPRWLTLPKIRAKKNGINPVNCRRPKGHDGECQNKNAGWKWWRLPGPGFGTKYLWIGDEVKNAEKDSGEDIGAERVEPSRLDQSDS